MRKQILSCLSSVLLLAACTKNTETRMAEPFVGTWQWLKTDGGLASQIHETPASTGREIELKLTPSNSYQILTDGAPTSQGTYLVETRRCIHDGTNKSFLNFSVATDTDMMVEAVAGENMTLSDERHDGVTSQFKKKNSTGN